MCVDGATPRVEASVVRHRLLASLALDQPDVETSPVKDERARRLTAFIHDHFVLVVIRLDQLVAPGALAAAALSGPALVGANARGQLSRIDALPDGSPFSVHA
jgi:hypothetical protein